MEDPERRLLDWWRAGHTVAVATVVASWQSAPRSPGSIMVVGPGGEVSGGVSGGCVEGAVYESCRDAVATGRARLEHYGVSDEAALSVGLTCGGELDVFVEPVSAQANPELGEAWSGDRRRLAAATVIAHDDPARLGRHVVVRDDGLIGTLGTAALDSAVARDARSRMPDGPSGVLSYRAGDVEGEPAVRVFVRVFATTARLLVFGASDLAVALAHLGRYAGYAVTVCDPRSVFATPERFGADVDVVNTWPHSYLAGEFEEGRIDERTAVAVLTHDPKFDVPALRTALGMPLAYVGLLGSRRTCADRRQRLIEAGVSEERLARLRAPIGLHLGGRTPQEVAVSIVAELIALRHNGTGLPLSAEAHPIHP